MEDLHNKKNPKKKFEDDYGGIQKKITFLNVADSLLKRPGEILYELAHNNYLKIIAILFITISSGITVFGLINGTFSGHMQIAYSALKYPIGLLISSLICLPSLYIFLAISGVDIKFSETFGVMLMTLSLTSILLFGFTPVLWLFLQSTNSIVFIGILNIIFWLISVGFSLNVLIKCIVYLAGQKHNFIKVWIIIFLLVVFQMSTTMRPLIGESNNIINTGKKFFLVHWFECMTGESD